MFSVTLLVGILMLVVGFTYIRKTVVSIEATTQDMYHEDMGNTGSERDTAWLRDPIVRLWQHIYVVCILAGVVLVASSLVAIVFRW